MRICPQCEQTTLDRICPRDGFQTVDAELYTAPSHDPLIGTVFEGRYRIEALLGAGGMSTVYRAIQLAVERPVALKLLSKALTSDLGAVARFQQEARAVASLRHPNTIRLFDYGQTQGMHLYLVMEFLEGDTLATAMTRSGPFPPDRVIHIARQVFDALSEAHERGIIHRDLKPENLFLTRIGLKTDLVKILDFGIAKVAHQESGRHTLTSPGVVVGSPAFIAPEQVSCEPTTPQTDLYSMGAIMYEMLSGRPVFEAETPMAMLVAHAKVPPRPLAIGKQRLRGALPDFIMQCLEKDPARRPEGCVAALATLAEAERRPLLRRISGDVRRSLPTTEVPVQPKEDSGAPDRASDSGVSPRLNIPLRHTSAGTAAWTSDDIQEALDDMRSFRTHSAWLFVILGLVGAMLVAAAWIFDPFGDGEAPPVPRLAAANPDAKPASGAKAAEGVGPGPTSDAGEKPSPEVQATAEPDPGQASGVEASPARLAPEVPEAVPAEAGLAEAGPVPPPQHEVRVDAKPAATVWVEGEKLGETPQVIRWPVGQKGPRVRVWRAHYEEETFRLSEKQAEKGELVLRLEYDPTH
jgi:serine/threonine-protein kinase